jgi:hypothetical protein
MSTVLAGWVQMATHCKAKALGTYVYSIGWLGTDGYRLLG